jgi:hypothetical protein
MTEPTLKIVHAVSETNGKLTVTFTKKTTKLIHAGACAAEDGSVKKWVASFICSGIVCDVTEAQGIYLTPNEKEPHKKKGKAIATEKAPEIGGAKERAGESRFLAN